MPQARSQDLARTFSVPEHLSDILELMSREMGVSAEALLAQSIFTFARLNGYVVPGRLGDGGHERTPAEQAPARPQPPERPLLVAHEEEPRATQPRAAAVTEPPPPMDEWVETRPPADTPPPQIASSLDLEADLVPPIADDYDADEQAAAHNLVEEEPPAPTLHLMMRDRQPLVVEQERFLIGRGKHCDLVIESNRVSREHAAIELMDGEYFIEDLKSSNGTWYRKQRINRQLIKEGDEFVLGTEKIWCSFRGAP